MGIFVRKCWGKCEEEHTDTIGLETLLLLVLLAQPLVSLQLNARTEAVPSEGPHSARVV